MNIFVFSLVFILLIFCAMVFWVWGYTVGTLGGVKKLEEKGWKIIPPEGVRE